MEKEPHETLDGGKMNHDEVNSLPKQEMEREMGSNEEEKGEGEGEEEKGGDRRG